MHRLSPFALDIALALSGAMCKLFFGVVVFLMVEYRGFPVVFLVIYLVLRFFICHELYAD